jgi:putative thioredoxin
MVEALERELDTSAVLGLSDEDAASRLDVRARQITGEMELAAAEALAAVVKPEELEADYVIPVSSTARSRRPSRKQSPPPPNDRASRAGHAGSAGRIRPSSTTPDTMALDMETVDFEHDVIDRSHEKAVVVDFWADWCGPCHMLAPVLEQAVEKHGDRIDLVKVDVEENQELASRFGVQGIPAVKAFKKGNVVNEFVGAQPPVAVDAFLDTLLQPSAFERLLAELRESGEDEELLAALERENYEGALDLLLGRLATADRDERDRIRERMVALFEEIGVDTELAGRYRRQLASALY